MILILDMTNKDVMIWRMDSDGAWWFKTKSHEKLRIMNGLYRYIQGNGNICFERNFSNGFFEGEQINYDGFNHPAP